MRILKHILIIFFIVLPACSILKDARKVIAVKNLNITLSRVKVEGIDLGGVKTLLYVEAENPNRVDAKIVSFAFDVLVNSQKVAKGSLHTTKTIPALQKSVIIIPVYLPFTGMSSGIKRVLLSKHGEIGMQGYVIINTSLGKLKFKVFDKTNRLF